MPQRSLAKAHILSGLHPDRDLFPPREKRISAVGGLILFLCPREFLRVRYDQGKSGQLTIA
jgi:hypothetical protein